MNRKKLLKYLKEALSTLLIVIIFANIISYVRKPDIDSSKIVSFSGYNLDNTLIKSQDITKPTLIHIWATWCPTCKLEASNINRLSKSYNVISIAVKSGSNEEIKKYMNENEYTFNVINDNSGEISKKFNVAAFPTTLIYNSKQKLSFSEVGYTSTIGLYLRMLMTN